MPPYQITPRVFFIDALANDRPKAMAWVTNNRNNPTTSGLVKFYQPSNGGVLIEAEIFGLPDNRPGSSSSFFGMHIHDAATCNNTGSTTPPSSDNTIMPRGTNNMMPPSGTNMMPPSGTGMMPPVGGHFNPGGMAHPFHAGDMPPLLSNQGYAWTAFFDRRFTIEDIIGKTVIIHTGADDFTSQPSGNSGNQLACGEIRRTY